MSQVKAHVGTAFQVKAARRRTRTRITKLPHTANPLALEDGGCAPAPRAAPRERGGAASARARPGRLGAHAHGARARRASRDGARAATQTHTKDKAEIRDMPALLRADDTAESRAARSRPGFAAL